MNKSIEKSNFEISTNQKLAKSTDRQSKASLQVIPLLMMLVILQHEETIRTLSRSRINTCQNRKITSLSYNYDIDHPSPQREVMIMS